MTVWRWVQSAGHLLGPDGRLVSTGYAGRGRGVNNPALQGVRGVGPLPRGRYRIGRPRDSERTGRFVLDLYPVDATPGDRVHDATGRSAFQMHGDRVSGPPLSASSGCIIVPLRVRRLVARSGVDLLDVVE